MSDICLYESPIGILRISGTDDGITELCLCGEADKEALLRQRHDGNISSDDDGTAPGRTAKLLRDVCAQLDEYFDGTRRQFDVPLSSSGTPFQEGVWRALRTIPYGETRSYEDIAVQIGNPKAVRAVGQANNKNPLMILVPCHRVIHKNGDISGFACGTGVKRYLLDLEAGRLS